MNATLTDVEQFNKWHDSEFEQLPEFKLKVLSFLNGTVDLILTRTGLNKKMLKRGSEDGFFTIHPKDKTEAELEATRLENIERAARRARQKVHYLVRQLGADHMLTLTTRENIESSEKFDSIFQEFIRLVRQKNVVGKADQTGKRILDLRTRQDDNRMWPYVAVKELQDRGAYHMHIACVGRQDLDLLRSCWYVALGGTPNDSKEQARGAIDVQYKQKRFSGLTEQHSTFALVRYLTKYISKSFEVTQELGKARYKASRGIVPPIKNTQFLPVYWSAGDECFIKAIGHVNSISNFLGLKNVIPWNRGLDIYILRGEES